METTSRFAGMTDLAVQTSTYGAQVPQLFGRVRVAGTVIWATDLIEAKKTQGNGKGRAASETYSYSASFAVLLSARQIVRVERIWADGKLLRGAAGDLKVELGALRVHDGDPDQGVDPLIASAEGADAPAWRGSAYAVFEALQLGDYGNRIPSLSFEVVADEGPVALGGLIAALSGVTAEGGPGLTGFAATGGSARAVAGALQAAFPMICRDEGSGAHVRFAPIAGPSVDALDLGAGTTGTRVATIAHEIAPLDTTPAAITIAYLDPARDYQAGLQRARREGRGLRDERIDLPATLAAGTASAIAQQALAVRNAERRRATITLPWRGMTARPGDAVTVDGEDWRVAEVRFEQMAVQLDLVRNIGGATDGAGAAPGRNGGQSDDVHGPTSVVVVDLPALSDDGTSKAATAVFAAGVSRGWRRASLLASIDEGASYIPLGTTALPATMGVTTSMLPVGATALIDAANSVEVMLLNAGMTLRDADTTALLGGANRAMIGREMLQFGRATPMAPGRWRLSHLWRGRRGTEDGVEPHPAGTPFVLVEEATSFVLPSAQAVSGVRVMASGLGDADPWPQAICPTAGRAALPLTPVHPVAEVLSSGDVRLGWARRSRQGWAWRDGADASLGEEREAYRVSWFEGSAAVAEPTFTYSAALRARHRAMGLSNVAFDVRQSGDGGLSPPLVVTINLS